MYFQSQKKSLRNKTKLIKSKVESFWKCIVSPAMKKPVRINVER